MSLVRVAAIRCGINCWSHARDLIAKPIRERHRPPTMALAEFLLELEEYISVVLRFPTELLELVD